MQEDAPLEKLATTARPPRSPQVVARPPLPASMVERLQRSWEELAPRADEAAAAFYGRLFELDPSLRALFQGDLGEQKRKLVQTLALAVDGLSHQSAMRPVLASLGLRHSAYHVEAHHYDSIGKALLWTLRHTLGPELTPELERAWAEAYAWVTVALKEAADEGLPSPTPRERAAGSLQPPEPISSPELSSEAISSGQKGTAQYTRLRSVDPALAPLLERGRAEDTVPPAGATAAAAATAPALAPLPTPQLPTLGEVKRPMNSRALGLPAWGRSARRLTPRVAKNRGEPSPRSGVASGAFALGSGGLGFVLAEAPTTPLDRGLLLLGTGFALGLALGLWQRGGAGTRGPRP